MNINNFRNGLSYPFKLLLELGADVNQVGWIQVGRNWYFGSPRELAYQINNSTMKEHYRITADIMGILSIAQEKLCKQKTAYGNRIVKFHFNFMTEMHF